VIELGYEQKRRKEVKMERDTLKTILILAALGVGGYFIYQRFFKRKQEIATAPYYPPTPGSNVVLLGQTVPQTSQPPITSIPPSSLAGALNVPPPAPPSYTFHETVITTPSGAGIVTL
jgi:hypothetical protein